MLLTNSDIFNIDFNKVLNLGVKYAKRYKKYGLDYEQKIVKKHDSRKMLNKLEKDLSRDKIEVNKRRKI